MPTPTLHIASDMGPVGLAAQQVLLCRVGLRMTTSWDNLHRLQANLQHAQQDAGLLLVKFEFAVVCKLRKGPFKPGGANWSLLKDASREFVETVDSSNALFQLLFDDLSSEASIGGVAEGSEEHEEALWACVRR